jgi:hypothetical protein
MRTPRRQSIRAILAVLLIGSAAFAGGAGTTVPRVLEPLDYQGVTLDGGMLKAQFDEVRAYYLAIPNDNLLKGFRSRAGLPAPGTNLGGWYSSDTFHVFGQILSGLSRMYATTGDPACRAKVQYLVDEWAKCIEADGFFYYSRTPNARHYTYDKMVCGLVDAWHYANIPEAAVHLETITAWAETHLAAAKPATMIGAQGPTEWYTLSENLYRAFEYTGNTRYRDFAREWEYDLYWNAYASGTDIFTVLDPTGYYHAYSHVNTLSGAAVAFRVWGDPHYLDTTRKAHDYLTQSEVWATGGYGPHERLLRPAESANALQILDLWSTHFETMCGSWAVFKLCKGLIAQTGGARYGDWAEEVLWNGIGASIPMSASGVTQYYSHYFVGGARKSNNMPAWACCTGTRPQAVADYPDLVYFRGPNALHVNLFADSSATLTLQAGQVGVVQRTRFPAESGTSLTLHTAQPSTFTLAIRAPQWLAAPMTAEVNGQPASLTVNPQGWATLERLWSDGDSVRVSLPMALALRSFPRNSASRFPAAIVHGPVVLAVAANGRNPLPLIDFDDLRGSLVRDPGDGLQFHLTRDPSFAVKPYYAFAENEKYFMHFDPGHLWLRVDHMEMTFAGQWNHSLSAPDYRYSRNLASSAEYSFVGTAFRFRYQFFDEAGFAGVSVDGGPVVEIDQYSPWRGIPFYYAVTGLSSGPHTVRITVLDKRNAASSNGFVNVAGVDYIPPGSGVARVDDWRVLH